jgi:hypothetical protein
MSGAWVRSGVLVGAAPLILELGGDPAEICHLSGVSTAILADPDMPVAAAGVVAFLAQAAKSCACPTSVCGWPAGRICRGSARSGS